MNNSNDQRLKECLRRCMVDSHYLDTFYEVFLDKSERARVRFTGVDMAKQKSRLAKALPRLLAIADLSPESHVAQQTREAHRHHHLSGEPTDYATWIQSLCETFRRHDSAFDDEMETLLTERLRRSVLIINPEANV